MTLWMEWIRKRPIAAFFVLCYAISLGLWLPLIALHNKILEILVVVGLFGPALACIFVARALPAHTRFARAGQARIPIVLAWGASALILALNSPAASAASPAVLVVFAALALVPAYVISSAFNGPPGVRETLSSMIRPRGWWGWYLLAVLLPPALRLLSAMLSQYMGWEFITHPALPTDPLKLAGSVLILFLYTLLYAGGLNEEAGWTGLALPRLQARFNPLIATLVVWFFWILWHVPLHLAGLYDLSFHVLVGTFFARFVFTWLYNRSYGGLLTAILFHTAANTASQFMPVTNASLWIEAAFALVVVLGTRMWQRLPAGSPAAQGGNALPA
jgi:membrane protease YdiL (CAAX protease family)